MLNEHQLNVTHGIDHMALMINDLLLVLDCVSGSLIGRDRVVLHTGGRDLPLSETIWFEMWGCSLYGLCAVVYGGKYSLMESTIFH